MIRLSVKKPQISLSVRQEHHSLAVERAVVVPTGGKPYEGAYEVTPTVEGFTLPTARKVMSKDLTVNRIPYYEMDNTAGTTVFIGSEV